MQSDVLYGTDGLKCRPKAWKFENQSKIISNNISVNVSDSQEFHEIFFLAEWVSTLRRHPQYRTRLTIALR